MKSTSTLKKREGAFSWTVRIRQIAAVVLLSALAQAPQASAALLGLEAAPQFATAGDSISLDLIVSDLGDFGPDSLSAFDISVAYDAAVLSFSSYLLGGFLGDLGFLEALDVSAGDSGSSVNLAEVSLLSALGLDALQPGEFLLATLNFEVLALGVGEVTEFFILRNSTLANGQGFSLSLTDTSSARVVGVATVPIPGVLLLQLAALVGWAGLRRSRSDT